MKLIVWQAGSYTVHGYHLVYSRRMDDVNIVMFVNVLDLTANSMYQYKQYKSWAAVAINTEWDRLNIK